MRRFLLDASALAKGYLTEPGSPLVDYLLDEVDPAQVLCLSFGALETLSVIVRAQNARRVTRDEAERAIRMFAWEILFGPREMLHPPQNLVQPAAELIERHNVNATDALLLRLAVELRAAMRAQGDDLAIVAADDRLLRAARREGMPTFNPETEDLRSLQVLARAP